MPAMQILENGNLAAEFAATDLDGNTLELKAALSTGPVILVFAHPVINASRLVVGYLRRLKDIAPGAHVWIVSEGTEEETRKYAGSADARYLEMPVVVDRCKVAGLYGVKFLPTTYLIGQDGRINRGYSGFNRDFMNLIANKVATDTGAKPKELIADGDNKGFYELAERGPCG
jgi:peroxiredoxin